MKCTKKRRLVSTDNADIVERLRNPNLCVDDIYNLHQEAADNIEILRSSIKAFQMIIDMRNDDRDAEETMYQLGLSDRPHHQDQ